MPIEGQYRLTFADYKEAQAQFRGLRSLAVQAAGGIIAIASLGLILTHRFVMGLIGILYGGILAFVSRIWIVRTFKKEASLREETNLTVSEEGVKFASSRSETKTNWSAFIRYAETQNLLVLYMQSRIFYAIPKRAFQGEDLVAVSTVFRGNIKPAASRGGLAWIRVFTFVLLILAAIVLVYFAIHAQQVRNESHANPVGRTVRL